MTEAIVPHRGRRFRAPRVLIYGPQKVGKTTFASQAKDVILVGNEDGADDLDCAKMPSPETWGQLSEQLRWLADGEHNFNSVALDTIDWIEPLLVSHICQSARADSINDGSLSYGKGVERLVDEWRKMLKRLEMLRAKRNMAVILLAHAHVKTFANPSGADFDRWELKCRDKVSGLCMEWVDVVGFMTSVSAINKDGKAVSTGERLLHTSDSASWVAGSRWSIPSPMAVSPDTGWKDFMGAIVAAYKAKEKKQ